uniref:Uncharacterized protein n=1 Tax=Tetradesmus obliquus TaxID=3088 RepID=A0A383VEQ5_TETOB|eukprot:jgi/Sobl393_1/16189/SZX63997.1
MAANVTAAEPGQQQCRELLRKDAEAANLLSTFLARRDIHDVSAVQADLCVVCGSSVLATAYVAVRALQSGSIPRLLISGGCGHSTAHLYNSMSRHPLWHSIDTTEGRHEAEVLHDLFLALGVQPQQQLPLELDSRHCGGNASCSKQLVDKLGLAVKRVLVIQDPTMQLRTHASFTKWWSRGVEPCEVMSYSPLRPRLCVSADSSELAFVPESVSMEPPVPLQQLQQWAATQRPAAAAHAAEAGSSGSGVGAALVATAVAAAVQGQPGLDAASLSDAQGLWGVERFLSLLLGEIPRLRDAPGGYGPRGSGFIDAVDIPQEVEAAWAWLAGRYPQLLRA